MANEAACNALLAGREAFEAWRRENPTAPLDFCGFEFIGLRAAGLDLSGAMFDGCALVDADFSDTNLSGASLDRSVLNGANLSRANLMSAKMRGVKLERATAVNATFIGADLGDARVTGANLTGANFADVKAEKATLEGSQLQNGVFRNSVIRSTRFGNAMAQGADFTDADLSHSSMNFGNLDHACFERAKLLHTQWGGITVSRLNFRYADLSASDLIGCDLSHTDLSHALLDHATLTSANLSDATISDASFRETHIEGTFFARIRGIADAKLLDTTRMRNSGAMYLDSCEIGSLERHCSWEFLRTAGRLPLFGASYSTLILIPLIMYMIAVYNDKVEVLRSWSATLATKAAALPGDPVSRFAETIDNRLHPLAIPSLSLILLLSTLLLAVASTLYTFFCPPRIKEFSSHVWQDQFGRSLLHYWPSSWAHRRLRVICGACYGVGGLGALYVLSVKIIRAGIYIWHHSAFSWF